MITAINTTMTAAGVANWAALGDSNRNLRPGGLGAGGFGALPGGFHVVHPQQQTRPSSGRELDYMITNDLTTGWVMPHLRRMELAHTAMRWNTDDHRYRKLPENALDSADRIDCPILLLAGSDNKLWPGATSSATKFSLAATRTLTSATSRFRVTAMLTRLSAAVPQSTCSVTSSTSSTKDPPSILE